MLDCNTIGVPLSISSALASPEPRDYRGAFVYTVKGMAFEVIPFCRIVKFSGITRFLYQFWKILPKYCGRKEKDHNILWSKWYSRRESNPQRPLRRGLLYPFNYGSVLRCKFPPPGGYQPKPLKGSPRLSVASLARTTAAFQRGLLYPFNYGSV